MAKRKKTPRLVRDKTFDELLSMTKGELEKERERMRDRYHEVESEKRVIVSNILWFQHKIAIVGERDIAGIELGPLKRIHLP